MNLLIDHQIPEDLWNDFHRVNLFSSPYQSPLYYHRHLTIRSPEIKVFAVTEINRIIALVVVNLLKENGLSSFFSRRAIIYGGPLIENSDIGKRALSVLLQGVASTLRGKAIYCEIRNSFDYSGYNAIFTQNRWHFSPHYSIRIGLEHLTDNEILKRMHPARRREIRMSQEAGVMIKQAAEENDIRELYDILYDVYHNRVKLPLPDFTYFKQVFLSPPGLAIITVLEKKVIGGAFCFYTPRHSLYTPYYAGMRLQRIFPTTLAIYGTVEFALQNGIKVIDLMGAGKPGIPYGVRDFKLEFGGDLMETGRYIKIENPVLYHLGKTAISILKKIS